MRGSKPTNGRYRVLTHSGAHKAAWEVVYSCFAREHAEAEYDRLAAECEHGGVMLTDYRGCQMRVIWDPASRRVEHV